MSISNEVNSQQSAATTEMKTTVRSGEEKYYLVSGGGEEGVAYWSGILPIIASLIPRHNLDRSQHLPSNNGGN